MVSKLEASNHRQISLGVTKMKTYTILVADDEPKIVDVMSGYLQKAGYSVICAFTGRDALRLFEANRPSLVILDLMLPDVSGEDVCMRLRRTSSVPILMLTAKHAEQDRIDGLHLGADDYVTKPCSPKEVVARVGAILRRSHEHETLASRLVYHSGDLVIDNDKQCVLKSGVDASLTFMEYRVLTTLCRYPGRVFKREELIETAFGMDFRGGSRAVDAHIKNLRSKIEDNPKEPVYVQTVYGIGYRFGGMES